MQPLSDAERELAADNLGLAFWAFDRWRRRCPGLARRLDPDDARQLACLLLLRAAKWYRDQRGFAFSSYVKVVVMRGLSDAAAKARPAPEALPDDGRRVADPRAQDPASAADLLDLREALDALPARVRAEVLAAWGGERLADIGRQAGQSKFAAGERVRKAERKLQLEFGRPVRRLCRR